MKNRSYLKKAMAGLIAGGALFTTACEDKVTGNSSDQLETEISTKQARYAKACEDNIENGYRFSVAACYAMNKCVGGFGRDGKINASCKGEGKCHGTLLCLCENDTCENDTSNPGLEAIESQGETVSNSSPYIYRAACLSGSEDGYVFKESDCKALNSCKGSLDGGADALTASCAESASCKGTMSCICEDEACEETKKNPGQRAIENMQEMG